MAELLLFIILFAPLAGGIFTYLIQDKKSIASVIALSVSLISALYLLLSNVTFKTGFDWLPGYKLGILIDSASLVLIAVVLFVSLLVHVFSQEYMQKDSGIGRYFFKLGLFTFSMVGLLLADHLILLFIFWELVGLCSYLLIGFWYRKEGVPGAARLAFMVNRVADVSLLAGILMLQSRGLNISDFSSQWLFLPSILVSIGAFGKSAQLPFSGWLTKAMVGPTPVSALIHAATMVAAGVYLLFRVAPFLHQDVLIFIAVTGVFTAFYAGLCALMQHDIKKVLAYSTISQLGYMVMGIGVGAQSSSMFHLFTHAFFKAGLFLGAGAIIHFMHQVTDKDAQDMRNMGGLKKQLPWTYRAFLICSLALAGIPFFSGFLSKEGIIIAGWEWASDIGSWAYLVPDIALITAFLTAFYVGRMIILIFFGESRLQHSSVRFSESLQFKLPLVLFAAGSIWIWYSLNPLGHETWLTGYFGNVENDEKGFAGAIVTFLSLVMAFAGLILAYSFFRPASNYFRSYAQMKDDKLPMLSNGFYLQTLYMFIGKGLGSIAQMSSYVDRRVVDGSVHLVALSGVVSSKVIALIDRFLVDGPVNLIGFIARATGRLLAGLSSRDLQVQLVWLLLGIILILSLILFF